MNIETFRFTYVFLMVPSTLLERDANESMQITNRSLIILINNVLHLLFYDDINNNNIY